MMRAATSKGEPSPKEGPTSTMGAASTTSTMGATATTLTRYTTLTHVYTSALTFTVSASK
jgi:hypothetical protein